MVIKMIQKPKGTADIFLQEAEIWQYVEETARILLHDYQFSEIRTPSSPTHATRQLFPARAFTAACVTVVPGQYDITRIADPS